MSAKLAQAIREVMLPSVHHAAAINTIGCHLLCHLTGQNYEVVAGSLIVRQGGNPIELRADVSKVEEDEYYLWIELRHADGRVELVDFAAPYWKNWALENGAIWLGPNPGVVWAFVDELDEHVARYTPDTEITNIVRVALHNAFRSPNPPEQVGQWESAINRTIDLLALEPLALEHLIKAGVAEPAGPSRN
ncbi:MAG: hypothetical protein HUU46_21640 [Candidatus Hydrogenedentes bacterium]|nr:hypothetical protein [Candidatus Hydrogenedentota bacterium]